MLAFLPLIACSDVGDGHHFSTGPAPAAEQPSSTFFGSRLPPEEERVALEIIEQIYAERGMPPLRGQIAVSQNDLPDNALAVIVRSSASPERPTLVISPAHLEDEVIVRAIMAYAHEAEAQKSEESTAWITIGPEFVNHRATAPVEFSSSATRPRITVSDRLWRDAASVTRVTIPGIGPATLFRFH